MSVDFTLPEYTKAAKKWALIRAIVDNDAGKYIPDVDKNDKDRSLKYRANGILTNFTGLTKKGLQGLVFLKEPEITLPTQLDYLNIDATGSGLSLTQLAQQVCGEVLETGRYGMLVDFPRAENDLSIDDLETGNYQAKLRPYTAESIINWRTERVNGKTQLVLVVLKECKEVVNEDGFSVTYEDQYRVLRLVDNIYFQVLYNEKNEIVDVVNPTKADDGGSFNYIPFVFIGSENNDPKIDNSPLYDLAVLDMAAYRNSCDLEESIFVCGQPCVVICTGDIPPDQWLEVNGGKFRYGSRGGTVVGLGGNATLLQANANQLAGQGIKDKIEQATLMGARFIVGAGGRETAEAARIRYSSQNSALYVLTKNIDIAFVQLLVMMCDFTFKADASNITFELNDKFYEDGADPQLIAQAMLMLDRGALGIQELREYVADPDKGLIRDADASFELAAQIDPTE